MDNIPQELHIKIASYLSYKDMIMFKSTSKYFNDIIFPEEILYDTVPFSKILNYDLYSKYYRGKSYDTYKGEKDMKFTISSTEKIIYQRQVSLKKTRSPEYYIITLNSCYNFILYEFNQEVHEYEDTPDYYGHDDGDYNKFVLRYTTQYSTLNDLKTLTYYNDQIETITLPKDIKKTILNING
jgi:hypothetical protein